jgi:dipeptidyl aminopeptidase/acylaminoacyl peptidase
MGGTCGRKIAVQTRIMLSKALVFPVVLALSLTASAQQTPAQRLFQPDDLFRLRQVGQSRWSPDGRYASIEFTRPGRALNTVPTAEIQILDVKTHSLRPLTSNAPEYLGFFNVVWSPNGQRLAFLSVDGTATVRPWIWSVGDKAPTLVPDLDVRIGLNDPPILWIGNDRLALLAWDVGAEKSGSLYMDILRGRNAADGWKRAFDARLPAVSAVESGGRVPESPTARLVVLDLRTKAQTAIARGPIHRVSVSPDQRFIAFLRETPSQPVASYFKDAPDVDALYLAVQWGTERHVIDAQTGAEVDPSSMPLDMAKPTTKPAPSVSLPRPDARRLSFSPAGDAALYVANGLDGSHLWISSADRSTKVWHANEWIGEIKSGKPESISYTATDGTPLTAWLLLPPGHVSGTRVPMVTVVYPGTTYGPTVPSSFSFYQNYFNHPQLFAALGYAVLLPSMPAPKDPANLHALAPLSSGVLPALDEVIARGIADPDRIAVVGQSGGGFATLGLITQTNRFRSGIASASYSNLTSLYGSFYGQYRYGDAGPPEKAQVLRMLQLEKGFMGLGGPPWAQADRYREQSPIHHVDKVETPLMLIHGEFDFIPIQQAEEFFTALYRQDKRVTLLRYHGEEHTISTRPNVLDLWKRIPEWLSETMAPRKQ